MSYMYKIKINLTNNNVQFIFVNPGSFFNKVFFILTMSTLLMEYLDQQKNLYINNDYFIVLISTFVNISLFSSM